MAVSRALRAMKSTSATSSMTGVVLGITIMVVTPPAAAALLALPKVSRCSAPGSPVNTRISTRPGQSTFPLHSIISASLGAPSLKRAGPKSAINSSLTKRWPVSSYPDAGSIKRAFKNAMVLMTRLQWVDCERGCLEQPCGRQRPFLPAL